jgi:hypothetical protein
MKFATALLAQVLLVSTTFAIPSSRERLEQRVARRAAGTHLTQPKQSVPGPEAAVSNGTNAEFSSNWSGAVLIAGSVCIF